MEGVRSHVRGGRAVWPVRALLLSVALVLRHYLALQRESRMYGVLNKVYL